MTRFEHVTFCGTINEAQILLRLGMSQSLELGMPRSFTCDTHTPRYTCVTHVRQVGFVMTHIFR